MFILNAMRYCSERITLHCVYSYLYYIILVKKKIFSEGWNEVENNKYSWIPKIGNNPKVTERCINSEVNK